MTWFKVAAESTDTERRRTTPKCDAFMNKTGAARPGETLPSCLRRFFFVGDFDGLSGGRIPTATVSAAAGGGGGGGWAFPR